MFNSEPLKADVYIFFCREFTCAQPYTNVLNHIINILILDTWTLEILCEQSYLYDFFGYNYITIRDNVCIFE